MSRLLVAQRALTVPGWVKDDLSRKARAIPSLDLRFADNKSLVDAVTGAQLVTFTRASSGTYVGSDGLIKTAVTNLLVQSQNFSTSWINTNLTPTSGSIAPDGTATAFTINEDTAVAAAHSTHLAPALTASSTMTLSVYAKNVNARYVGLAISTTSASNYGTVEFDLDGAGAVNRTAVAGTGFSIISSSITAVSSGWFRCVAVIQLGSASVSDGRSTIYVSNGASSFDTRGRVLYTGTSRTLEIWGAQLEQASTVGEYIPTTSTINSAPRFDHNPTTGESLGLLVEEARTNLVLRSEEFNDASWTKQSSVSVSANTTISPDGNLTADTITADQSLGIFQSVAATVSTTYTNSVYIKAGTATAMMLRDDTGAGRHIVFNPSTGVITATSGTLVSSGSQALNNGWYRYFMTYVADATTVRGIIRPNSAGSAQTFITWGAQIEAGAFATSYIPTTTATATRAADVASITGSNFSSWYNQTEGTVFANTSVPAVAPATSLQTQYAIHDGSADNRITVYKRANADTSARLDIAAATVNSAFINAGTFGLNNLTASAVQINNFAISLNGLAAVTDTAGNVPSVNQMNLGSYVGATGFLNGTIRRITYWPTRLATLQAISQP